MSNTKALLLVAMHELNTAVRTKGFWISIILVPVLFIGIFSGVAYLTSRDTVSEFVVFDETNWIAKEVRVKQIGDDIADFRESVDESRSDDLEVLEVKSILAEGTDEDWTAARDAIAHWIGTSDRPSASSVAAADRFANWWIDNRETVARIAPEVSIRRSVELPANASSYEEFARTRGLDSVKGVFVIPSNIVDGGERVQYHTKNFTDFALRNWYTSKVQALVMNRRVEEAGIDRSVWQMIQRPVSVDMRTQSVTGEEKDAGPAESFGQWAPIGYTYVMWIILFASVMGLLTNTIEEKNTKLVEVLLGSVSAASLMNGKIIGNALTILCVFGVWALIPAAVVVLIPILGIKGPLMEVVEAIFRPYFLLVFIVHFLMAYVFYGTLISAVGSTCGSMKEAQTITTPVTIVLFMPFLLMFPVTQNPDTLLAQVTSFIPLVTPFVMMARSASDPSLLVQIAAAALMLVCVIAMQYYGRRVYARGILMESRPVGWRALTRLLAREKAA